jgi:hypothetical protein
VSTRTVGFTSARVLPPRDAKTIASSAGNSRTDETTTGGTVSVAETEQQRLATVECWLQGCGRMQSRCSPSAVRGAARIPAIVRTAIVNESFGCTAVLLLSRTCAMRISPEGA